MPYTCILCGKSTSELHEHLCSNCFSKKYLENVWMSENIDIDVCGDCGAVKRKGQWMKSRGVDNEINYYVKESIKFPKGFDLEKADTVLKWEDERNAWIEVDGHFKRQKIRVIKHLTTRVRLKKDLCQSCSRQRGNYYEAILQVRGRIDQETARNIMDHFSSRKGDFFISRILETAGGIDYYFSDANLAKQAASRLASELGGEFGQSAKLYGLKEGKNVYRMTYLIRLPEYRIGDIVCIGKDVFRVKELKKKDIKLVNLSSGRESSIDKKTMNRAKILGGNDIITNAMVLLDHGNELQIMDPVSYKTVTLIKPAGFKIEGESVKIVRHEDDIYLVA